MTDMIEANLRDGGMERQVTLLEGQLPLRVKPIAIMWDQEPDVIQVLQFFKKS